MSGHEYTEQDFINMMNQASDEIMPSEPWTLDDITSTFNQINELLAIGRGRLEQNLRDDIVELVALAQRIQHPEVIDADFLGLYTVNLMRLLDTPNPNLDEIHTILDDLSDAFNQALTIEERQAHPVTFVAMAVIDITYNDTSRFDKLSTQKYTSDMTKGDINFDNLFTQHHSDTNGCVENLGITDYYTIHITG